MSGYYGFRNTGDAAVLAKGRLESPAALLMTSPGQALADLARLRTLDVDWYCCGHSDPGTRR